MYSKTFALAALPALALAASHDVDVGKGGLVFEPSSITAADGDTINFHFYAGDHSVAQSSFAKPCVPIGSDAIYSGFIEPSGSAMEASKMFTVTVSGTDPLWFYCSQISHCSSGMAFAVNPTSSDTIAKYIAAAANAGNGVSPSSVQGGVISNNVEGGSAPSSSAAAASSSAPASSSSAAASSSSVAASSSAAAASSSVAASSSAAVVAPSSAASGSPSAASVTPSATSVVPTSFSALAAPTAVPAAMVAAAGALGAWALL